MVLPYGYGVGIGVCQAEDTRKRISSRHFFGNQFFVVIDVDKTDWFEIGDFRIDEFLSVCQRYCIHTFGGRQLFFYKYSPKNIFSCGFCVVVSELPLTGTIEKVRLAIGCLSRIKIVFRGNGVASAKNHRAFSRYIGYRLE